MKKRDFTDVVDILFSRKDQATKEMTDLLSEFHTEFPPRRFSKGYVMQGLQCGKKGCTECPHSLKWRYYVRHERKVVWGKNRVERLPPSFWKSNRDEVVLDRFRYYQRELVRINKERGIIQTKIKNAYLKILAAMKSVT